MQTHKHTHTYTPTHPSPHRPLCQQFIRRAANPAGPDLVHSLLHMMLVLSSSSQQLHTHTPIPHTHTHTHTHPPRPCPRLPCCITWPLDESCDSRAVAPVTYCTEPQHMPAATWDKSRFRAQYSRRTVSHTHCGGNAKQGGFIIFIIIITPGVGDQQGEVWESGNPLLSVGHVYVCVCVYI